MKSTNPPFHFHATARSPFTFRIVAILATLLSLLFVAETAGAQVTSLDISAPTRKQVTPSKFTVSITASDLTNQGVIAFQFNILYDPTKITPVGSNFGCVTEGTLSGTAGMVAVCNVAPAGTLRVAVYGAYPMVGSGTVLNLKFATAAGAVPGTHSMLNFENLYFFNESGYLQTTGHNGRITFTPGISSGTDRPADIEISLPDVAQQPGSTFVVPLAAEISPESAVTAFQFNVAYDPKVIDPTGPNFGCSTEGTIGEGSGIYAYCTVISEGLLHVAVFTVSPIIDTSGTLMNLTFTAAKGVSSDRVSPLDLQNVYFAGNPTVNVQNGRVALSEQRPAKR